MSTITCHCKNTCNRSTKRGACPCRTAGKPCTDLCTCGWSLPCINRELPSPPQLVSGSSCNADLIENRVMLEESDLLDNSDRSTPQRKKQSKKRTTKRKRNHEEVEEHLTSSSTKPACVRKRLDISAIHEDPEVETTDTPARRGRKTSTPRTSNAVQHQTPAIRQRQAVENFAAKLDESSLRNIVVELLTRDQGAFQDYSHGYRPTRDDPPTSPTPQPESPDWCRCGNCRPMATPTENKCCKGRGATECATHATNFYLVVEPAVLDLAIAHYNDFMVHDQVRDNAAYRHQAYRQFVLQRFGRLGTGNRRVVPSCVVLAIRDQFPDPQGQYTGFIGL